MYVMLNVVAVLPLKKTLRNRLINARKTDNHGRSFHWAFSVLRCLAALVKSFFPDEVRRPF